MRIKQRFRETDAPKIAEPLQWRNDFRQRLKEGCRPNEDWSVSDEIRLLFFSFSFLTAKLILLLLIAFLKRCSPLSGRLTALSRDSTRVTSFLSRVFFISFLNIHCVFEYHCFKTASPVIAAPERKKEEERITAYFTLATACLCLQQQRLIFHGLNICSCSYPLYGGDRQP